MDRQTDWQFLDDRGHLATSDGRPERVVTYIQAGATLWEHGIRPAGLFGSNHDGDGPDPVKAGSLPLDGIGYLGSGAALDADALLRGDPDLVVAVTYGGGQVYGLDPDTAKHVEERAPLVVLDVGQGRSLGDVRARFAALARALGAAQDTAGAIALARATARLRALAHDTAARPCWPCHRRPPTAPTSPDRSPGRTSGNSPPSASTWCHRGEAPAPTGRPPTGRTSRSSPRGCSSSTPGATRTPWTPCATTPPGARPRPPPVSCRGTPRNPEEPYSDGAHARFFDRVADAVEAAGGGVV
nr:ABC transporter substrate-binding protein [Streptomyces marianii]